MTDRRILLDTVFIQALLNQRDQYHGQAKALLPRIRDAEEVWVTEAVLVEVGNALAAFDRTAAARFIRQCYRTPNIRVVTVDRALLEEALTLYANRPDKHWGLRRTASPSLSCASMIWQRPQQQMYTLLKRASRR